MASATAACSVPMSWGQGVVGSNSAVPDGSWSTSNRGFRTGFGAPVRVCRERTVTIGDQEPLTQDHLTPKVARISRRSNGLSPSVRREASTTGARLLNGADGSTRSAACVATRLTPIALPNTCAILLVSCGDEEG
jgi:hypothetical protein